MILIKILKAALCFCVLCSTFNDTQKEDRRHIQVSGRAVDNKGESVKNVIATLDVEPCNECSKDVLPSNRSIDDGVFFVDTSLSARQHLVLYLTEAEPVGFWSPVSGIPNSRFAHLPEFRGIQIRQPTNSSRVDLGDVPVKIRFGKVILQVPNNWKAIATESTPLVLRLRDRTGVLVFDDELPLSAVNAKSDSLRLALTEGRWKVQLVLRHSGKKFASPVKSVVVKPTSCETIDLVNSSNSKPCT